MKLRDLFAMVTKWPIMMDESPLLVDWKLADIGPGNPLKLVAAS
jgi:hypothetical protein